MQCDGGTHRHAQLSLPMAAARQLHGHVGAHFHRWGQVGHSDTREVVFAAGGRAGGKAQVKINAFRFDQACTRAIAVSAKDLAAIHRVGQGQQPVMGLVGTAVMRQPHGRQTHARFPQGLVGARLMCHTRQGRAECTQRAHTLHGCGGHRSFRRSSYVSCQQSRSPRGLAPHVECCVGARARRQRCGATGAPNLSSKTS